MLWMATPTSRCIFIYFFLTSLLLTFLALSMTFGVACDLYHRWRYVVYGSYGTPIENHVITFENLENLVTSLNIFNLPTFLLKHSNAATHQFF